MKNLQFQMRIMKIMKITYFDAIMTKNGNLIISCENKENHDNHRIPFENQENHENHRNQIANNKIIKILKFQ